MAAIVRRGDCETLETAAGDSTRQRREYQSGLHSVAAQREAARLFGAAAKKKIRNDEGFAGLAL